MKQSIFPPPETAGKDGILAISADLNTAMLKDAYFHGIFPWPYEEESILWCAPEFRGILPLDKVHIPDRLKRDLRKNRFTFRMDSCFDQVVEECAAAPRPGQNGTWITKKIRRAYSDFHKAGYAHSFEAFDKDGRLAGGLYGVSIGKIFCGESMFHNVTGASKFAFVHMTEIIRSLGAVLLDTQMVTSATESFGAYEIPRKDYLELLEKLRGEPLKFPRT